MKFLIVALALLTQAALAAVPRNAECIVEKGEMSCRTKTVDGTWESGVRATCVQPIVFRLSDLDVILESVSGSFERTSSTAVSVLTLGANDAYVLGVAKNAAKLALKEKLKHLESCGSLYH